MIQICLGPIVFLVATYAAPAPTPTGPTPSTAKRHCQVPCGIYGDMMRIHMILEDVSTIEKGMKMIGEVSAATPVNYNQLVRWINNKDTHALAIQDNVAAYWLAQRVKAPKAGGSSEKYLTQLALMHAITVGAMKCKQTTDNAWPTKIRSSVKLFVDTYFTEEQRRHLREQHGEHQHK